MIRKILNSVATLSVALLLLCKLPTSDGVPASECPRVLSYTHDSRKLVSRITLDRPLYTTEYKLEIKYCVPSRLVRQGDDRVGRISADNEDKRVVRYSLAFPFSSPVPVVQSIKFNGREVCPGSKAIDPGIRCFTECHLMFEAPRRLCGKLRRPDGASGAAGVQRGDWPWLVGIFHQRGLTSLEFKCGGSLIDKQHILTSANCLLDDQDRRINIKELFVKVGVHDLVKYFEEHTEIIGIGKAVPHPMFRPGNLIDDIAIITLSRNVSFTPYITPVCLWDPDDDEPSILDKPATVVSWGQTEETPGTRSAYPLKRTVPIVTCHNVQGAYQEMMFNKTFCAGSSHQPGVCQGDTGGGLYIKRSSHQPGVCQRDTGDGLYVKEDENWTLRGIISSPLDGVCTLGEHITYTDVAKHSLWIQDNI